MKHGNKNTKAEQHCGNIKNGNMGKPVFPKQVHIKRKRHHSTFINRYNFLMINIPKYDKIELQNSDKYETDEGFTLVLELLLQIRYFECGGKLRENTQNGII